METIFREYDIRGIVEKELNEDIIKKIGYYLAKATKKNNPIIAVGYDARIHSTSLKNYLVSGLNHFGAKVLNMGLVPTGVNYFSSFNSIDGYEIDASIMITGSHNPKEYNGFKITINKKPFFGEQISKLKNEVLNSTLKIDDNLKTIYIDAKKAYINYMLKEFEALKGCKKRFVFDCGNGAVGLVLDEILTKLGLNFKIIHKEPDGTFPNHHPDPSEEENLIDLKEELKNGFDFGFAFDGDGDRLAVLSQKYSFKGDILAIFFAKKMQNPVVIGEVKCSQVMYDEINKIGKAVMYKTGHSNLKTKLKELNATLATEVSGHLFFNDRYFGYDDAIYGALRVIELIDSGFDLDSEFEKLPKVYSTDEINIATTEDKKFKLIECLKNRLSNPPQGFFEIKEIIDIDGVRVVFDDGWGLIRASNTTPKLVTRFEASTKEMALSYQKALLELLKECE